MLDLLARGDALEICADAQQLVEVPLRIAAFDPPEQRGLERRPQTLRNLVEPAAYVGRNRARRRARFDVALEGSGIQQHQRAFGQGRLVACLSQIVQERQQHQRDVFAAAEQPLEVRRKLNHCSRQRFHSLLGLLRIVGLRKPAARELHFFREESGTMDLDDLQSAACDMQHVGRAQQSVLAGVAIDVFLELAPRAFEGVHELAIDELERMGSQIVHAVDCHAVLARQATAG